MAWSPRPARPAPPTAAAKDDRRPRHRPADAPGTDGTPVLPDTAAAAPPAGPRAHAPREWSCRRPPAVPAAARPASRREEPRLERPRSRNTARGPGLQHALVHDEIDHCRQPLPGLQVGEDEGPVTAHAARIAVHH